MSDIDDLLRAAAAVRRNAHAPYSRFKVGAALRSEDGHIHIGANVENASYPEGLCAEAAAIAAMIAAGARQIEAMAIMVDAAAPASPCGGCRQRIAEFAQAATPIHLGTVGGAVLSVTLGELLPLAFHIPPGESDPPA